VALLRGPIALFGVGNMPERITRKHLTLRPFASIMNKDCRLYQQVES
jgi:hypothetical protein